MSTYLRPSISTSTLIDQTSLLNSFPFNASDYRELSNVINTYTNPIIIDGLDMGSLLLTETTIKGNQRNLSVTTTNASTLNLNDNKTSGDLFINNNTVGHTYLKSGNIYFDATLSQSISYNDATKTTISKDLITAPSLTVASLFTTNKITEVITAVTSGATVTCNYNLGGIFSTTAHTANFTIAITNVPTTLYRAVNITLLIDSSANKFYGNAITINGTVVTPIYNGGSTSISVTNANLIIQQITIIYLASVTPFKVISSVNSVY